MNTQSYLAVVERLIDRFQPLYRCDFHQSLHKIIGLRFVSVRCIKEKELRKKYNVSRWNDENNYVAGYEIFMQYTELYRKPNYHYRLLHVHFETKTHFIHIYRILAN